MAIRKLTASSITNNVWYRSMLAGNAAFIPPAEVTGGTVVTSGGYVYHTFTTSGNLTVANQSKTVEILMIGGGGSGGNTAGFSPFGNRYGAGGGGGAGQVKLVSSKTLTPNTYAVVVGAGGAGAPPTNGSETTVAGETATGGMYGAGIYFEAPLGACGGGQGWADGSSRSATAGTITSGGNGVADNRGGGGGGMAENGSVDGVSLGGDGINTYSTWATATSTGVSGFYGGGGGGGNQPNSTTYAGGDGGGGAGASSTIGPTNGVANTGSGGGGSSSFNQFSVGASGASGLVIVRYAA